jgi:hypothetical protein
VVEWSTTLGKDDEHLPTLTVGQTLKFSLLNKTRKNLRGDVNLIIDALLRMFAIKHTENTIVGNAYVHGVSGGKRKAKGSALPRPWRPRAPSSRKIRVSIAKTRGRDYKPCDLEVSVHRFTWRQTSIQGSVYIRTEVPREPSHLLKQAIQPV